MSRSNTIERAVYVRIRGGLGNQMFQYAAARALSEKFKCPLKLDVSRVSGETARTFMLDLFGIDGPVMSRAERAHFAAGSRWRAKLGKMTGRRNRFFPRGMFIEPHFHYSRAIEALTPPLYLDGNWQSPRYFESIQPVLTRTFTPGDPLGATGETVLKAIAGRPSFSIHMRRGDYVEGPFAARVAGACTIDYYRRAIDLMRALHPGSTAFVFSDDIDYAREALGFLKRAEFVDSAGQNPPHVDMMAMRACDHNIIANSSFSWWAAWLNDNPAKTVIAPRHWFATETLKKKHTFDLYPDDWILVR